MAAFSLETRLLESCKRIWDDNDWVVRGLVIVGTGLWCGCNFGPPSVVVSGTVSYQGEMVRQGEIIFADVQSTAPAAVGKVEDGRYRLETLAGEKRVRITASKETGRIVEGAMGTTYPEQVDLLPPEYNSASTLVRTVEPKKECVLDFQLK